MNLHNELKIYLPREIWKLNTHCILKKGLIIGIILKYSKFGFRFDFPDSLHSPCHDQWQQKCCCSVISVYWYSWSVLDEEPPYIAQFPSITINWKHRLISKNYERHHCLKRLITLRMQLFWFSSTFNAYIWFILGKPGC